MSKPFLLFRGPIKTVSGYGAHSRELLQALYEMNMFDIKIDSCNWGVTPMTALEKDNLFHNWIESNIITNITNKPDIYVQVTVPNEFNPIGNFNIGVTAGIETTIAPQNWIEGCNKMNLVIATSKFSKDVLTMTAYNDPNPLKSKVQVPIEVLFEGVDLSIFRKVIPNKKSKIVEKLDDIQTDFNYLFVGHWLKGKLGQDRKDVGMLIRCFVEAFKNTPNKPGLILKTSSATFSVGERENFRKRIEELTKDINDCPPIYLLFGELSNNEMNDLYNHPKVKAMVSITKGEGFGKPLLEFTMTGKPVVASNWSGHKDFLPENLVILVGGSLTDVDESAADQFILKGSKWFTANYNEFAEILHLIKNKYNDLLVNSETLMKQNIKNFSFDAMKELFANIMKRYAVRPQVNQFIMPELKKID